MTSVNYADAGDMPPQTADWTCSACSLAWMNRALSIELGQDEWSAVEQIGQPEHINPSYGLMDASGARLAHCLTAQGAPTFTCWPDWEGLYQLADRCGLLIGGVAWNHWVVARTVTDGSIWLANSAPGWMGITDTLTDNDFYRLGPFAAVVTPVTYQFPPPAAA